MGRDQTGEEQEERSGQQTRAERMRDGLGERWGQILWDFQGRVRTRVNHPRTLSRRARGPDLSRDIWL